MRLFCTALVKLKLVMMWLFQRSYLCTGPDAFSETFDISSHTHHYWKISADRDRCFVAPGITHHRPWYSSRCTQQRFQKNPTRWEDLYGGQPAQIKDR
jgi:hypothetical protein